MPNKYLVGATAALLCLRFVTAFLIPLTPQEAYYWNYAMHPALSYFDHPPMVAWVIGAGYFL
ncbi:glycosyl transferase, partial [bacterium]